MSPPEHGGHRRLTLPSFRSYAEPMATHRTTGAPRPRSLSTARPRAVARQAERLRRFSLPRLQMGLIVAATGASGFLFSWLMLRWGVDAMWLRYPVAVALAYLVFLGLLRLWLAWYRRGLDPTDFLDLPSGGSGGGGGGGGGAAEPTFSGGGGRFGGGGASSDFGSPSPVDAAADPPLDVALDAGRSALDVDESLPVVAAIALAVAVLGGLLATLWIVWIAPVFLAEVLVDGLLLAGLYKRLGVEGEPRHWIHGAVRRTWKPVLAVAIVLCAAGWVMQLAVPEARSIGAVWAKVVGTP